MSAEEGTQHEDYEWEAQRENFTQYYMTKNRTLKDAARCMIENHNFHATPRQWERKVNAWDLKKYTSRQSRLNQIQSQGRSLQEVARAGRRPKSYDAGLLHPAHGDDRNSRRFARRELSRSRSRSRSNSFGRRSRSTSPRPDLEPSEEVVREDTFALEFSTTLQPEATHTGTVAGSLQLQAVPIEEDSFDPQAHLLHLQDSVTGETRDQLYLSLPTSGPSHTANHDHDTIGHGQYNFADLDRRFSIEAPHPPQIDLDAPSQFPPLETNFDDGSVFMDDISPTFEAPPDSSWISPPAFPHIETVNTTSFIPDTSPQPSYHVTPTSDIAPNQEFQADIDALSTPTMGVPQLVFPPSPSPSNVESSGMSPYPPHGHLTQATTSQSDQRIYADFYASVNRYSQAVLDAVTTSATAVEQHPQILQKLSSDLTVERGTFFQEMTMTLNSFVLTQQRAVQSMHEQCNILRQQRRFLQIEKVTLERENLMMKQMVHQIPGAAEHMEHQHRFSLPGNYVFGTQPPIFTQS